MDCAQCRRTIPIDSRFCSFCGAEISQPHAEPAGASGAAADHEAETVLLSMSPPAHDRPSAPPRAGRLHRPTHSARRPILLLVLIFVSAFAAVRAFSCLNVGNSGANSPDPTRADAPASAVPAPDASAPELEPDAPPATDFRAARLDAFRAALDAGGLTGVHFRMVGDTMVLTGTVPTATDEAMVQMLALNVAGVASLKDQIRVQNGSAGP